MTKKFGKLLYFILIILVLSACTSVEGSKLINDQDEDNHSIKVVTTIAQIGEPLSVIGGDFIEVETLMGPSIDPHLYSPTQSDMAKLADAEIIFYNGLNLEANMIDAFESIGQTRPVLAVGEQIPKRDLLEDEDEEGIPDPHIWFDLDLWEQALEAAVEELKNYAPEHAVYFETSKQRYFEKLGAVKEDAKKLADIPKDKRVLVTAHDAFNYFGRMHDIEVIGLQGLSTDSEVSIADINRTIDIIKENQVPAIFVESSISPDSIEAVLEGANSAGIDLSLGGELYSDAMGQAGTEEGTYIGMYKYNVETIYKALSEGLE